MENYEVCLSENQICRELCLQEFCDSKEEIEILNYINTVNDGHLSDGNVGYMIRMEEFFRSIFQKLWHFQTVRSVLFSNETLWAFFHIRVFNSRVSDYIFEKIFEIHHWNIKQSYFRLRDAEISQSLEVFGPIYYKIQEFVQDFQWVKADCYESVALEPSKDYSYLDEIRSLTKRGKENNKIYFGSIKEYKNHFIPLVTKVAEYEQKGAKSKGINIISRKCEALSAAAGSFKFFFNKNRSVNIHNGDLIVVKYDPSELIERQGRVREVSSKREWIKVIMGTEGIATVKDLYFIEVIWSPIIFDRIINAFKTLSTLSRNDPIVERILGSKGIVNITCELPTDYTVPGLPILNDSQVHVIKEAMQQKVAVIQGPPGTGKTMTCAALVYHLVKKYDASVLVCGPSNVAVDALYENIKKTGINVERIYAKYKKRDMEAKKQDILRTKKYIKQFCSREGANSGNDDFSRIVTNSLQVNKGMEEVDVLCANAALNEKNLGTVSERHTPGDIELKTDIKDTNCHGFTSETSSPTKIPTKYTFDRYLHSISSQLPKNLVKFDKVLQGANVICTTCIGVGSKTLSESFFDVVLIDEAAQAIEPECIVPISRCRKQLILVGDNFQLGPIVRCPEAAEKGLLLSMYERFIEAGVTPLRLEIQYRMHPAISEFSSLAFYDGKIKNGVNEDDRTYPDLQINWPVNKKPLLFYCSYGPESISSSGTSFYNDAECDFVVKCAKKLRQSGVEQSQIGVITPYDGQRRKIVGRFEEVTKNENELLNEIAVANIHGFQGQEKDFIIISCVRSNNYDNVGFMNDYRMINVAITRAKYGLILVGNPNVLRSSIVWGSLLRYYTENNLLVNCDDDLLLSQNRPVAELCQSITDLKLSDNVDGGDHKENWHIESTDCRNLPSIEETECHESLQSRTDLMENVLHISTRSNVKQTIRHVSFTTNIKDENSLRLHSNRQTVCKNYMIYERVIHANIVEKIQKSNQIASEVMSDLEDY